MTVLGLVTYCPCSNISCILKMRTSSSTHRNDKECGNWSNDVLLLLEKNGELDIGERKKLAFLYGRYITPTLFRNIKNTAEIGVKHLSI